MARFISPITDMKPNGSLRFFKSGTNTTLITYKDELESIQNPTIVPVLPNGNVENVFYQGSAKVIYLDEFDQQYAERDPVGGEKELGAFVLWDTTVTYDANDIVLGSDGLFYKSLTNANTANDPTTTPTEWEEIRFIGMWNINVVYAIGEVTQTSNGNLWKAKTATAGNDPSTDDGTNWLPAIDGAKVPEVIALEVKVGTANELSGGGTLIAGGIINQIIDSDSYAFPAANSVGAKSILVTELPTIHKTEQPTLTAFAGDTLSNSTGTDTTADYLSPVIVTWTSDGVSTWSY
jgi:hypothetical protein